MAVATPASSRHTRTTSPPLSTASSQAFTSTIGHQQKLNVVTRLAIEGHAKKGQDGAAIKMYLKVALPLESVNPGSTIPLFPEENIKILTSQVHPIDTNSVPYNFSSTTSPLLHNAARALNLPARSPRLYLSLFGGPTPTPSSSSIRSSMSRTGLASTNGNGSDVPPLDERYTGYIVVSGYNVSYVVPKEFPPRAAAADERRPSMSAYKSRRPSVGDKNVIQFMAAIDMWVPFVSKPPKAPYLISIPTPRCLSNNIKLRIFPPPPAPSTSASFASLSSASSYSSSSSADTWDLTSDPHVTRASSRTSPYTYTHFADDESSDSSAAAAGGCGVQGTFPSAERVRVRWAAPVKAVDAQDARRRVGVREVRGDMACTVLGLHGGGKGVVMGVEYKATCRGVWFPGVATLLGMDVGLDARGADVAWALGEEGWSVSGSAGYTGFDVARERGVERGRERGGEGEGQQSVYILPSSPDMTPGSSGIPTRQNSASSSTSSLLRAPLPAQNGAEYSFEGSGAGSGLSETISSLGSLPLPSTPTSQAPSRRPSMHMHVNGGEEGEEQRPPAAPVTVHINMNDLLPPSKNVFTFTISGTIVVTPRPRARASSQDESSPPPSPSPATSPDADQDADAETPPLVLPRFTVLAAADETTSTAVRNEVSPPASVEVFGAAGDIGARKTVLRRGGMTRCGVDGGRVVLRMERVGVGVGGKGKGEVGVLNGAAGGSAGGLGRPASLREMRSVYGAGTGTGSVLLGRPKRDGPLMIPSVLLTVTPLLTHSKEEEEEEGLLNAYAVRMCLPAPSAADSEWLEFGFAQPSSSSSSSLRAGAPRVDIAGASVGGVPVRFETAAAESDGAHGGDLVFGEMGGKEWVCWVRVCVGEAGGGEVVVDYVVRERGDGGEKRRGKRRAREEGEVEMDVFLPALALPVGKMEVDVETALGFEISSLRTNLAHQQILHARRRLFHFSLPELFYPRLSIHLHSAPTSPAPARSYLGKSARALGLAAPTFISLVLLLCLLNLGTEFRRLKQSLDSCSTVLGSGWENELEPVTRTVTSTVFTSGHSKWWFGETISASSSQHTSPLSTHVISSPPLSAVVPEPTRTAPGSTSSASSSSQQFGTSVVQFSSPFPWPLHFNFSIPPAARETARSVVVGLGRVWQVFRKVYHYPLDPP